MRTKNVAMIRVDEGQRLVEYAQELEKRLRRDITALFREAVFDAQEESVEDVLARYAPLVARALDSYREAAELGSDAAEVRVVMRRARDARFQVEDALDNLCARVEPEPDAWVSHSEEDGDDNDEDGGE